ncbi:chorismate--pyruvate lyase family protein [Desulfosporosinus nitroreducens]|uniref:chorismate--pyruvate lyase family protein n=1 Tax=Desulfosporosinus nitroreducens TaxID=2018668 RepID=UPI00207C9167|nr:chorismate pyruvate-lyase family protein [Desulfosporosinus nitroreducens]MCO1604458.1 chorismate pyruvate-lyase family protein [Desulfosporosinus nitroreducens]
MMLGKSTTDYKKAKPLTIDMIPNKSILQDKSLSLFQKILLATDGTVTDLLSLYTGEKIKVRKIKHEVTLSDDSEVFLCPRETPILKRNILLCSETENYIYAESIFVFEQLSRSIQYKLLETNQPIGLIWKEEKVEMYRKIIDYKIEPCDSLSLYFNIQPQILMLSRTYLIYHKQNIVGLITEKFPINLFKRESTA